MSGLGMKTRLRNQLTQAELKALLRYDPATGTFYNLTRRGSRAAVGAVAGTRHREGYWQVRLAGHIYLAHRLAFLYMTGEWPEFVDHINGDRADFSWSNLRAVSRSTNNQNLQSAQCNNVSGLLGVSLKRDKFEARIYANGKLTRLGVFPTPEEAHQAYLKAKRDLHKGCTI